MHQCENLAVLYCVKLQHFLCDLNNHGSAFIMLGYMLTNSATDMGICMHDWYVGERACVHGSIKSGGVVWTVGIKARHLMHDVHKYLQIRSLQVM